MMRIVAMDHIVLNVRDVERSVSFYRDVLGMPVERLDQWRQGAVGFPSVRISADTLIDLVQAPASHASGTPNMNHFCLVTGTDQLEPLIEHLAVHTVRVHTGPAKRWGAHGDALSIYFNDPDGNEIEVRSYRATGA